MAQWQPGRKFIEGNGARGRRRQFKDRLREARERGLAAQQTALFDVTSASDEFFMPTLSTPAGAIG